MAIGSDNRSTSTGLSSSSESLDLERANARPQNQLEDLPDLIDRDGGIEDMIPAENDGIQTFTQKLLLNKNQLTFVFLIDFQEEVEEANLVIPNGHARVPARIVSRLGINHFFFYRPWLIDKAFDLSIFTTKARKMPR